MEKTEKIKVFIPNPPMKMKWGELTTYKQIELEVYPEIKNWGDFDLKGKETIIGELTGISE